MTNSRADPHKMGDEMLDGEMLPLGSVILAKAIKIQSISLASLLRKGLFCKRGVLKNFAKFTGASSGTGVSCGFYDIL